MKDYTPSTFGLSSMSPMDRMNGRRFLGWETPVLPEVVERLFELYCHGSQWDMRHVASRVARWFGSPATDGTTGSACSAFSLPALSTGNRYRWDAA